MDLHFVSIQELSAAWPFVSKFISDGLKYSNGRYNEKIVVDKLLTGEMQLWVLIEDDKVKMSTITQIMTYPTGMKVCEFFLLGGTEMKSWVPLTVEVISKWAIDMNCSKLQIIGRKGWERVLKNWNSVAVLLDMPLGDNHG